MKKIVKLTETDLTRLVKRTINEMEDEMDDESYSMEEYQEILDKMKGELVELLDDATYDLRYQLGSMLENVEDNESLDKEDKYDLLDEIEEILNDIDSISLKYDTFRPKKGYRR
jgi:TolA-binding protein